MPKPIEWTTEMLSAVDANLRDDGTRVEPYEVLAERIGVSINAVVEKTRSLERYVEIRRHPADPGRGRRAKYVGLRRTCLSCRVAFLPTSRAQFLCTRHVCVEQRRSLDHGLGL